MQTVIQTSRSLDSFLHIFFGGWGWGGGVSISRDEGSRVGMDVGGPEQGGGGDGEEAHTDTTVPGLHLREKITKELRNSLAESKMHIFRV
jgi:hypothetical protein